MKRALSTFMFVLLLVSMLTFSSNLQSVEATGTIYVRADGSIEPSTAPIQRDGDIYALTGNITSDADGIVIERDNMTLDGASYTIQGGGSGTGVNVFGRTNLTVRNMQISNFGNGIIVDHSDNVIINENNLEQNQYQGLYLWYSSNCSIAHNNASNNGYSGIRLYDSDNSTLIGNIATKNVEHGIWLDYAGKTMIIGNRAVENGKVGISLGYSHDSIVEGNTASYNVDMGFWIDYSENLQVVENTASNNTDAWAFGLRLDACSNSTISRNVATGNNATGIQLFSSENCTIARNLATYNNLTGIWLHNTSDTTVIENDVYGNYHHGVGFYNSTNCKAYENSVNYNGLVGIWLDSSSSSIVGNSVTYNAYGIGLSNSCLTNSSDSKIFHNSFVNNAQQAFSENSNAWDDGYPSGGNYWGDYAGVDLYSGRYQNESGSDDMGDTPYVIDANNQDTYPLMNPWPLGWKLDFAGPTNHPIVDFAVYKGSLYAAADNRLYVKDGSSWNVIDAPTFVTSLEPYGDKLVVGGQGGLYCYDGTSFDLIFSVPTYVKVLGVYGNRLYAGTMLDNPPKLYYCKGSPENPSDWYIDTDFLDVLDFTGPFGSIDSFAVFNSSVDNPVGFWRFNEGSGATAYDSSGNDNDGTIYGASWITGKTGNCLGFDGDDLVEILDNPDLNPSEITVETWVNFGRLAYGGGYSDTDDQMLICKGGWPRVGSYRLWQGGPNSSFQVLYFDLGPGTYVASPELTLQTNRWYHLAGTYDGNTIKLYLDGVLQASRNIGSVPVGNAEPLYFGYHDEYGWNYYLNGSLDEVAIYNHARTAEEIRDDYVSEYGKIYITSGGNIFCYNGTAWSIARTFDDVYAYLDMEVHNGKLYLATRDQGWRKPLYQGGTGFSGRVIEFDGENWTTILDHDYWVYSLGVYDGKLYAGTANKILTYNGTSWEVSFNATEGAYYAISMITYDSKLYAGMGNGYIFVDPAPLKPNPETTTVPEFSPAMVLTVFMALTILATVLFKKKRTRGFD